MTNLLNYGSHFIMIGFISNATRLHLESEVLQSTEYEPRLEVTNFPGISTEWNGTSVGRINGGFNEPANGFGPPLTDSGITLVRKLRLTLQILLILIGCPGNIMTIVVMRTRKFRSMNMSILFIALAVSDTLYLLYMPAREVYELITGELLKNTGEFPCKFVVYFVWILYSLSSWLLVAFSLERSLAIILPVTYQTFCSRSREILLVIAIVMTILGYNAYALVTLTLRKLGPITVCAAGPQYEWFYYNMKHPFDLLVQNFIPFALILFANVAIIIKVRMSDKNLKALGNKSDKRSQKSNHMTGMLLSISFAFLVLTLPIKLHVSIANTQEKIVKALDFDNVTHLIVYSLNALNHSINFYLYLMTGEAFKQEVLRILGLSKESNDLSEAKSQSETKSKKDQKGAIPHGDSNIKELPVKDMSVQSPNT